MVHFPEELVIEGILNNKFSAVLNVSVGLRASSLQKKQ